MIKGILAKWQGLNNILNIPQIKEALKAIIGFNWIALESHSRIVVIIT
jgi:hypothetical protein